LLLGAAGGGAAVTATAFYVKQRRAGQLDLETAEEAGVAGRFRTVQPQDADVSVFAPPVAAPDRDILIQVMIHTPERESEALSRAQKTEPTAEELASIPLTVQLNASDLIRATLECEGAKIAEPVQSIRWNGRLVCLYFTMRVLSSADSVLTSKIRLFVNAIPAGIVIFKVKVMPGAADAPLDYAQQEGCSADRLPQPALDLAPVAHLAVPAVDPVLRQLLREMAMPFGDLGVARRAQHRRLPQLRRPIIAKRGIFGASALGAFEIRH
jgi:hypothetical protein